MNNLSYFKLWFTAGVCLVACVIFLSLTTQPIQMPQIEYGDKVSHLVAYAALSGWFCQLYKTVFIQLMIFALFCLLGVSLEVIQGMGGIRMFEYADMLANTLGAATGLWLSRTWLAGALLKVDQFLALKLNS